MTLKVQMCRVAKMATVTDRKSKAPREYIR